MDNARREQRYNVDNSLEDYNLGIYGTEINSRIEYAEAMLNSQAIMKYNSGSEASSEIERLTAEVLG